MTMTALNFQVNPASKAQIIYLGLERTPVIIIDDFASDVSGLKHIASESEFKLDPHSFYPGIRAVLSKDYVISSLQAVYQFIYQLYQIPQHLKLKPQKGFFSLISTPESQLDPLQCMPHFDTPDPYYFAVLHYLNDAPHGSTGFFRHKPTGFERITTARQADYFQSAQQFIDTHGAPAQRYQLHSNEHYELYQQIPYQANRLIIYPGNLLHSTLVDLSTDIDSSPASGRLTANIFIDFV
jgi:hypothetical protein